ncbi:unnamed protein product [Mycena citricolor]|uniref:DUF7587 domain-containing protein n=1 Tax=Mycena citricolor TaxID=2018698 RepID=A0AAD2JVH6_9AGAR|nr:unnamed protein product [Mycena citricolor]CAK5276980.1 unnamed protein product [Mycena citricolor]
MSLPQHGIPSCASFCSLTSNGWNRFLFRVYTPKSGTHFGVPFTGLRFDNRWNEYAEELLPEVLFEPNYESIATHLDWTTRQSSPYVSTSFSFYWALWEAVRRYHYGVKHDVEIAVIDARCASVFKRAVVVLDVLRGVPIASRKKNHVKWQRHAAETQTVFIHGAIPQSAVLGSIPLLRILDKLPSFCLAPQRHHLSHGAPGPLARVSWAYHPTSKTAKFHEFCAHLSAVFASLPNDKQHEDSAEGAVRLALTLVGGWFYWTMGSGRASQVDADEAVETVVEMAKSLARWPMTAADGEVEMAIVKLVREEVWRHRRLTGGLVPRHPDVSLAPSSSNVTAPPSPPFSECDLPLVGESISPISPSTSFYTPPATPKLSPTIFSAVNASAWSLPTPPPTPPPSLRSGGVSPVTYVPAHASPLGRLSMAWPLNEGMSDIPALSLDMSVAQLRDEEDRDRDRDLPLLSLDIPQAVDELSPIPSCYASCEITPRPFVVSSLPSCESTSIADEHGISSTSEQCKETRMTEEDADDEVWRKFAESISFDHEDDGLHYYGAAGLRQSFAQDASCVVTGFLVGALTFAALSLHRRPGLLIAT